MNEKISVGVHINQTHMDFSLVQKICKTAEELKYSCVTLMDHLRPATSFPPKKGNMLECWTTLGALIRNTTHIHLGPMVSSLLNRNPALVAKMAATLDHISNGRLKFGLGAGTHPAEFEEYGITFYSPAERVKRLAEAIQIIKQLWLEDEANYQGKYYTIEQAVCFPKPYQQPHPPIFVGGRGKQLLKVVAQFADGWNFPGSFNSYVSKLELLKGHCQTVGRDIEEIQLSWGAYVVLSADRKEIQRLQPGYLDDIDRFIDLSLIGTTEQCIKKLQNFIELGVTDFEFIFPDTFSSYQGSVQEPGFETMRQFAHEILPEV